jgi:hypothetical protein
MLPGMAVFRAVFFFAVEDRFTDGVAQMVAAGATALALGAGVVMGELFGSPLRHGTGRIRDFFRIEGPPGLRRVVGRVARLRPAVTPPSEPSPRRQRNFALKPKPATEPGDAEDANGQDDTSD